MLINSVMAKSSSITNIFVGIVMFSVRPLSLISADLWFAMSLQLKKVFQ
jgi:hypothetical protein